MSSPIQCFKSFDTTPLPEIIYFDTSFIINTLIKGQPYYEECKNFIIKLTDKQPIIVFSSLLKPEFWSAITKIHIRNMFGKKRSPNSIIKKDPGIIKHLYSKVQRVEDDFSDLLQRFKHWIMVELNEKILKQAMITMKEWKIEDITVFDWGIEDLSFHTDKFKIWTMDGETRYKKRHSI